MKPQEKAKWDIEGCEKKIRSACASQLTQKDWCDIWAKAKALAMKGRYGFLVALLPIVARKMPESLPVQAQSFDSSKIPAELLTKIDTEENSNAISH